MVRSHALFCAFAPVIIELFSTTPPIQIRVRASCGTLNIITIGLNWWEEETTVGLFQQFCCIVKVEKCPDRSKQECKSVSNSPNQDIHWAN